MAGLKLISKEDAINQMDQVVDRGCAAALVALLTHLFTAIALSSAPVQRSRSLLLPAPLKSSIAAAHQRNLLD